MTEVVEKTDLMDLGEFREDSDVWKGFADEAPVEASADKPIEAPSEPVVETKQTEQVSGDWLDGFNKSFNGQYKTVDELKSFLDEYGSLKEKVAKIDDYDAIIQDKQKLEKTRDLLIEKYRELKDPKSFFADDIEYKKNQLMKSNPSVNGEVARKALSMDLETSNPLDIIALNMQLTHSKLTGGEVGAKETFLVKHNIDMEVSENGDIDLTGLSRAQMNIINLEAEEAAKNILNIRGQVQEPEASKEIEQLISDWMQQKEEPAFDMTKWDGKIESVVKGVDVYEVKDGDVVLYSEPIDDEFKEGLEEAIREAIVKGKIEPTPENIQTMIAEAKKEYAFENMPSIMKRYKSETELKVKEQLHNKIHNDVDPDKASSTAKPIEGRTTPLNRVLGIR